MKKLLENPQALCNIMRRIAVEAGHITLEYFEDSESLAAHHKADGSPVTEADRAAENHIKKSLYDLLPEIPFIGEESFESGECPDITGAEYFWMVDPLDGTKEFLKGGEDYTVNIALIHKNRPVIGVIYAPVKGVAYAAHEGGRAVRWSEDTDREKDIRVRAPFADGLTVVTNYRGQSDKFEKFAENYKIKKLLYLPSSLKFCAIAEGRADIYPRFARIGEWDTAAGEVILRAAGGRLTDLQGQDILYGKAQDKFQNPPFIAAGFEWFASEENL